MYNTESGPTPRAAVVVFDVGGTTFRCEATALCATGNHLLAVLCASDRGYRNAHPEDRQCSHLSDKAAWRVQRRFPG